MAKEKPEVLELDGRQVRVTSPSKIYFPAANLTKLDVVRYYLSVAEGALRGIRNRPLVLKRYVKGIDEPFFFQKRAPDKRPEWLPTVQIKFPSGRSAEELVIADVSQLVWIINLGCIDLNPHPTRADDLEHPDELRVDLDPGPASNFAQVRRVALGVKEVLDELGLIGWPKTSGSRGIHINVRIERSYSFEQIRRAALALAREVERRLPQDATSKWWKEERHGVFLDYNQNAKDRTVASAYSLRPVAGAWVSAPIRWDELPDCELADFTAVSMPGRFATLGDLHAGIDDAVCRLDGLLELSARQEGEGMGDAPWPPHYAKQASEPARVQPSRRKSRANSASKQVDEQPKQASASGRRRSKMPLITVAQAADKADALDGLERWKARYPQATEHLTLDDVLIDAMRGRSSMWTRIRINLRHVPEELRPAQQTPDPDYDPWRGWRKPPMNATD